MSNVFDLKVGYSCNNNCRHCVIHDNKQHCIDNNLPIDANYGQLIQTLSQPSAVSAKTIVITGGEPTLRRDFMRIVRFICTHYPEKKICLQTNGRLLINYLEELHSLTDKITFVVALHGTEKTHNIVTNNPVVSSTNNPFRETMSTIDKIEELYGGFSRVGRIEIVLSKLNLANMPECLDFLLSRNKTSIGISYPHLDGMYFHRPEECRELSFSYEELAPILAKMKEVKDSYSGKTKYPIKVHFEEVPQCMFRDRVGKVYLDPEFAALTQSAVGVNVTYPGQQTQSFDKMYLDMHSYTSNCSACCLKGTKCLGIWKEAEQLHGSAGIIPITNGEVI